MNAPAEEPHREAPKGPRFTKVYDRGWDRIGQLITLKGGPTVAKLWVFLARHCGHDNALAATQELLAEELGVSTKSISRAAQYLEENGALVVAKMGTARVYILNDAEIWKTADDSKRFCAFRTHALVSKTENGNLRQRLTHLKQNQASLDLEAPPAPRKRRKAA